MPDTAPTDEHNAHADPIDHSEDNDALLHFEDGIDPELEALPAQINWFRPILMIIVIIFAGWVATKFQSELTYFFSSSEPVAIDDVTEQADAINDIDLPNNRYVSIRGFPTRSSLSCDPPISYFKLVGGQFYIERDIEVEMTPMACRTKRRERNPKVKALEHFQGSGRLISFDKLNKRYRGFMAFYENNYNDRFCAIMTDAKKKARLDFMTEINREKFKAERERYPSEAELKALMDSEPLCHKAYLIQADDDPMSFWPYFAVTLFLGALMLWNLFLLLRWTQRTITLMR